MSGLFKTDIPEKHFQMLLICNSANFVYKQSFYKLKHKILSKHGHADGMDLQIVQHKCWTCNGTGKYNEPGDCWSCNGSGIYNTNYFILRRYKINDIVLHVPMDEPNAVSLHKNKCKNTINGIIKHKDLKGNPIFCYGVLLWLYDIDSFFHFLNAFGSSLNTTAKHKWRQIMRTSGSSIKGFFNYFNLTLKEHHPEMDELPF